MTRKLRNALIVGFDRFGSVERFTDLFHTYGYDHVTALVNDPLALNHLRSKPGLHLARVDDICQGDSLLEAALAHGADDPATPFLCAQDRPTLAYLDAWRHLRKRSPSHLHVPSDGILRARVKPLARELWNHASVDDTKWTIFSEDEAASRKWRSVGGLNEIAEDKKFVVKPLAGASSEAVRACLGRDLDQSVDHVRSFLRSQGNLDERNVTHATVNGREVQYRPFSDVLVEEALEGNEYTVDGYVSNGKIRIAIQQKEHRVVDPFFGDGLIVSPPSSTPWTSASGSDDSTVTATMCHTRVSEFERFIERGLRALGLDNWVFHAEVMETLGEGLRFVELNPRPPGGLLWLTAALNWGIDPFEIMVRMHLGFQTLVRPFDYVTGQFPIYARKIGKISRIFGIDAAAKVPGVVRVVQAAQLGDVVVSLEKENYLAFIAICAPTHDEVRKIAARVSQIIHFE